MRGQAFHSRKGGDGGQCFFQGGRAVLDNACSMLELVDGQAGKALSAAAGGQHVARAGNIIAKHRRGIIAEEYRAGGGDLSGNPAAVLRHNLAMFWGKPISDGNGCLQVFDLQAPTVAGKGFLNMRRARLFGELGFDGCQNLFYETFGSGEQDDSFSAGAVFGLRHQVGGRPVRLGGFIGDDQDLAWPRQEVDGDLAEQGTFGGDYVGVARSEDFADRANGRCPASHGCNGLGAANSVNFRGAGKIKRIEEGRMDCAIRAARCAGDDFRAAGNLRQCDGHQSCRNERGAAAGNVEADSGKWIKFLSNECLMGIAHLPVFSPGDSAEGSNVGGGGANGSFDGNGNFSRFSNLCVRHSKRCRSEFGVVKFLGELTQGAVSVFPYRLNNVRSLLKDNRIKQA